MSQEIITKLAKYKDYYQSEDDAEMKARYKKKIDELEAQLKEFNAKEEQAVVAEEKKISEVEVKLNKYKDYYDSEDDAEMKARYKKKIDELQKQVDAEKGEIAKEQKVIEENNDAVKEVQQAPTKEKRKAAVKAVTKKAKVVRSIAVKKTQRKKRLNIIISQLDRLIKRNKSLSKYRGANVNLERDAARPAKPFGYRFKGKHDYRVPTKDQIKRGLKSGKVVYEGRANRSDKFPKGVKKTDIKLKAGGTVDIKSDKQRFGKPNGYRWRDVAVEDGIISKSSLSKTPSKKMRQKYPEYVDFENRLNKADKKPSRRYTSL